MLFKAIAELIAIAAFPFTVALMKVFAASVDGMTLFAAYHTAYSVVGVAVLLPATQWFTRIVERLLPSKQTALQRALDPSALASPVIAVETARRVVADVLTTIAASVSAALSDSGVSAVRNTAAAAALEEVQDFLSELKEPLETEAERLRMTSTPHALDHAARLAEVVADGGLPERLTGVPHDFRVAELCAQIMRAAQAVGRLDHLGIRLQRAGRPRRLERFVRSRRGARRSGERNKATRRPATGSSGRDFRFKPAAA